MSFAFDTDDPVLHDITFNVTAGEMVGIVGPTGGAKSTVLSMMPRFRDPDSGRICIDGVDIRNFKLHGLRTQIGFVLQETVLLRGTVARQHRLRSTRCHRRANRSSSRTRERRRIHQAHAQGGDAHR